MKKTIFLIMISFVFMAVSLALAADIPMMLNYQGYVEYGEEGNRVPFNGEGYFKFAIVNQGGNTTYWSNDEKRTTGGEPEKAVNIHVTNGVFTVKLGDRGMTNMSGLPTVAFDQQEIYVRVWFSDDGTNFELLSPDTQIVSAGFAYKAQTVVNGITSESDPTVLASVKDGVSWGELADIPQGFKDGVDNGIITETDPTVDPSVKDGIDWSEISNIPAGFDDGTDDGIKNVNSVKTDSSLTSSIISGILSLGIASQGVNSTHISNGSITNIDISNSAAIDVNKINGSVGIDYFFPTNSTYISKGDYNMKNVGSASVTISAPTSGYVLVIHTGYIVFFGENTEIEVGVGTSTNAFTRSVDLGYLDGSETKRFKIPYTVIDVTSVNVGNKTFYALAQKNSTFDSANANVCPQGLIAIFIPKKY